MAFRREMEDGVRIEFAKGAHHCVGIGDVGLEKSMPRRIHDLRQRRPATRIGQLIDRKHIVTVMHSATHRGGADETRAPRHDQSHRVPPGDRPVMSGPCTEHLCSESLPRSGTSNAA